MNTQSQELALVLLIHFVTHPIGWMFIGIILALISYTLILLVQKMFN